MVHVEGVDYLFFTYISICNVKNGITVWCKLMPGEDAILKEMFTKRHQFPLSLMLTIFILK